MIPVGPASVRQRMRVERETVWEHLANDELRDAWWPETQINFVVGGAVTEHWSVEGTEDSAPVERDAVGVVEVLVPGHVLGFKWHDRGDPHETNVLITLRSHEADTTVVISETGFWQFRDGADRAADAELGWRVLVDALVGALGAEPVEEAPADEAPAAGAPFENSPCEDASADEAPADEVSEGEADPETADPAPAEPELVDAKPVDTVPVEPGDAEADTEAADQEAEDPEVVEPEIEDSEPAGALGEVDADQANADEANADEDDADEDDDNDEDDDAVEAEIVEDDSTAEDSDLPVLELDAEIEDERELDFDELIRNALGDNDK